MRAIRTAEDEDLRYGWIGTAAAAKRIGGAEPVSTAHVLALIEDGEIRARRISRPGAKRAEWRIDPASLDAWLEARENRAA